MNVTLSALGILAAIVAQADFDQIKKIIFFTEL